MTVSATKAAARILGTPVPLLVPAKGSVPVLLLGEAPGPRGADKSRIPFFGDRAGVHLYAALEEIGAVLLPPELRELPWDGARFFAAGLKPVLRGVALGNAFDHCPTDDGLHFRTPHKREIESRDNMARLVADILQLNLRGLCGVVTLGKVAARTASLCIESLPAETPTPRHIALPHPSAQGLLSMAPNRGKGSKLADLEARWVAMCKEAVLSLGYKPSDYDQSQHSRVLTESRNNSQLVIGAPHTGTH